MPMVDLTKTYISQAIYVVGHELDKRVRYKQEDAEHAFRSLFAAQSQQTNVPDEMDPGAPRLIFQGPHKQLFLSQSAAQLVLGFERADKDILHQVDIIARNIRDIHSRVEQYKPQRELKESALILSVYFPAAQSREAMTNHIYERFLKIERLADVASTSFKIGFQTSDNLFLNIEVDVYELRRADFNRPPIGMQTINLAEMPIVEQGYAVKLDINNKPQLTKEGYINVGPDPILTAMTDFVSTRLNPFMGFLD